MARNDVYLNINSLSPADAVVTGQQDMTAATIPELVLGDTPTFNFYFTDNTNVWPSWAGNAAYTLTWALSDAVAGDFAPAATTGNATPITGGWSVVLPLNSYDLVGLLNTKRVGQPYPVQNLWQQLRVTDPSGNEITRAMVWTPVRYRAISDTQNTESASPTGGRFVTVNNVNELTTPTDAQFYAANPVPTSALGTASNGQLFIGNGTGFTKATLTAGTGVAITNGSGSITIDATNAQEILTATVKNAESVAITKGQVVYLFSATGGFPSVKLAYNTTDATSAKTFGVVSDTSIAPNGTGTVTCVGVVDGLNLGTYSDGDTVYLGATPGSFTATKPYAPNHLVYVGIIERANSGNGELYVRIQNGYELDEIHDVQITTPPASGSLLIRDNTLSLWKAARLTAGTNIAVTNGDAAVTVGLTGTVAVANGGTGVTTSTGTGSVVLSTSPSLTTPSLGAATATSINSTTIPSSKTLVVTTDKLSALAATTSSELAGVISDETGTGSLVFANTPTLVTPNIGAATGTSFNLTGSGTLGTTLTVNGTTDSSSKDTGAIITEGGLGVEKSATIGGNLTVNGGTNSFAGSGNNLLTLSTTGTSSGATNRLSFKTPTSTSDTRSGVIEWYKDSTTFMGDLRFNIAGGIAIRNSADQLSFATDDSKNATVYGNLTVSGTGNSTFAGNVGINTTPPAWSLIKGVNLNGSAFVGGFNTSAYFSQNWVYDGAEKFVANGYASRYLQDVGGHSFQVTASGTAGAALSWITAAYIPPSGNLLLGTTDSANGKLQLATHTTSAGGIGFGTDTSLFRQGAGLVQLVGVGTGGWPTLKISDDASSSASFQTGVLAFGDGNSTARNVGIWRGAANSIVTVGNVLNLGGYAGITFTTGAAQIGSQTTALTLDSSQNATFAGTIQLNSDSGLYIKQGNIARWTSTGLSSGTARADIYADSAGSFFIRTNGTTQALQINSSQNATFAGKITAGEWLPVAASKIQTASTANNYVVTLANTASSGNGYGLRLHTNLTTSSDYLLVASSGADAGTIRFIVKSNGTINAPSLPTSASGLSAGDIWNDGGTLKIV